jgi:chemotaxis signal transduction protein
MGSDAADDRGLGGLRLQVGEHHWAVPLDGVGAVAEAGPLTALPGATGPLEGLARIADRPFPQIDLAAALGGTAATGWPCASTAWN